MEALLCSEAELEGVEARCRPWQFQVYISKYLPARLLALYITLPLEPDLSICEASPAARLPAGTLGD